MINWNTFKVQLGTFSMPLPAHKVDLSDTVKDLELTGKCDVSPLDPPTMKDKVESGIRSKVIEFNAGLQMACQHESTTPPVAINSTVHVDKTDVNVGFERQCIVYTNAEGAWKACAKAHAIPFGELTSLDASITVLAKKIEGSSSNSAVADALKDDLTQKKTGVVTPIESAATDAFRAARKRQQETVGVELAKAVDIVIRRHLAAEIQQAAASYNGRAAVAECAAAGWRLEVNMLIKWRLKEASLKSKAAQAFSVDQAAMDVWARPSKSNMGMDTEVTFTFTATDGPEASQIRRSINANLVRMIGLLQGDVPETELLKVDIPKLRFATRVKLTTSEGQEPLAFPPVSYFTQKGSFMTGFSIDSAGKASYPGATFAPTAAPSFPPTKTPTPSPTTLAPSPAPTLPPIWEMSGAPRTCGHGGPAAAAAALLAFAAGGLLG
eukprot:TRINITY_DN14864_c0_g1_i1.p1 TRINITY_DN14864_c0_g1~~TRINITY_DN14864_c0_g1_i1.p1  ORF type:complete len:510 (+),score=83.88 TRINITY_DN14864_c0_g1_i1:217-1530(+)